MNLHDDFRQVRTNILMMDQLPPVSQAYRLILQEQRHKEIAKLSSPIPESMAFASEHSSAHYRSSKPFVKNQERPPVSGSKRTSHYFCDHCKISGHSIERCLKYMAIHPPLNLILVNE